MKKKALFFPLQYSPKDRSGAHDHSVRAGVGSRHLANTTTKAQIVAHIFLLTLIIDFNLCEEQVQYEYADMFLTVELRGAGS